MSRTIDTNTYLDTVCELLGSGAANVPVPVTGSSMSPFLHHGDTVYLNLPDREYRPGDIVLYRRSTGQYVLHRIIRLNPDGSLIMLGDAQIEKELLPGTAQICAIATQARHRNRMITPQDAYWKLYASIWRWVAPCRHSIINIRNLFKKNR